MHLNRSEKEMRIVLLQVRTLICIYVLCIFSLFTDYNRVAFIWSEIPALYFAIPWKWT